jgi:anthranilate synthase/aminodeoxychorismate synthase-like glutamine amidotransferase
MLLLIDNYDSFAHNLARYLRLLGQTVEVCRNDHLSVAQVKKLQPQALVLSPGPCTPKEAGVSLALVRELHTELPVLGICLGHQVIAEALGGRLVRAQTPMHGRTSLVQHQQSQLFAQVPSPFTACRYHSLVVDPDSLPAQLEVTASCEQETIMALAHQSLPLFGLQFHPEAILTEYGFQLLHNFLVLAGLSPQPLDPALEAAELCDFSACPSSP